MPDNLVVRTVPVDDPGDLGARPGGEGRVRGGGKWGRELLDGAEVSDEVGVPGCGPVAFGSFTFDPTSDGSVLVVPAVLLGRSAGRSWLTTIGDQRAALAPSIPAAAPAEVRWHDGSLTAPQWQRAVSAAVARIQARDPSKAVLGPGLYAAPTDDSDDPGMLLPPA